MSNSPKQKAHRIRQRSQAEPAPPRVACVSLGAGAGAQGALLAGARVVGGMDDDPDALDCFAANFPEVPVVSSDRIHEMAHPDVAILANETRGWARQAVAQIRPRVICFERKSTDQWLTGYTLYSEELEARDFGLPQQRKRKFIVAFRSDAKPKFLAFPFPDPPGERLRAGDILEEERSDLLVSQEWQERTARRDEQKRRAGFRFSLRRVSHDDFFPSISKWHAGLKTSMVVRAREGERLVSVKEAQMAMGLPAKFSLPGPRSRAFRLLAGDACVPIIRALVEEIQVWLY